MDKLGILESQEQHKLSHVRPIGEPIGDESPLLGDTSSDFLDLGLHTMGLGLQLSQVFLLANLARRLGLRPVRTRGDRWPSLAEV